MRRHVQTRGLAIAMLLAVLAVAVAAQAASRASSSGSMGSETGVTLTPAPTLAPTPSYPQDDCTACCTNDLHSNVSVPTSDPSLACCVAPDGQANDKFNTAYGFCLGMSCCKYGGRLSQRGQAWFPCLLFPTCLNDPNKKDFCASDTQKNFTQGASFSCTDSCCQGPVLESNVWSNVANAYPGQTNATFSVTFNPSEIKRAFFQPGERDLYTLKQIVLASPPDYMFGKRPKCVLSKTQVDSNTTASCSVSLMNGTTHLTVDIPEDYTMNQTFAITFDHVTTPSGVDKSASNATQLYSAGTNLVPVHFEYSTPQGYVYSTFYRLSPLEQSSLTSGSFLPENIYPGNSGNATLTFYTTSAIAKGSVIHLAYGPRWDFPPHAQWTWDFIADQEIQSSETSFEDSFGSSSLDSHEAFVAPGRSGPKAFASSTYKSSENEWFLTLDSSIKPGWVVLFVDQVQNPPISYTGLNIAAIEILDSKRRVVSSGTFSSISVEIASEPVASPYTYVTMVVLTGTLFFCTVVIRSNGLSFSFSSIWTDITAICTLLALITAIINNIVWVINRSSVYFYISRIFLCFTFTMLTAVCFHWGTVLHLHLRKVPQVKTVIAFVSLNLMFYIYQAVFLFYHQGLISKVYGAETESFSYASQQCKDGDLDSTNNVFSEIQGYMWSCYAQTEDRFFLVSTTVTSALFLALTVIVMALGIMVMRRGKLLVGNSTGAHQVVLVKALRLYYTLIGVVTAVYLLSSIVQLVSRRNHAVSYPWFYIFTVWLPESIPPCCLIFLQWNSTAKSLKDADIDPTSSSPTSDTDMYDEIRTPSFAFSSSDRWSDSNLSNVMDDDNRDSIVDFVDAPFARLQRTEEPSPDDFIGLSMTLETNEEFPLGCFVAIQRLTIDPMTGANVWRQISNTDTVDASKRDLSGSISSGRHVYSFMAVPRIPLSSAIEDRVRLVVYAVNGGVVEASRTDHHSEMTAERVLAAMERRSSGEDGSQLTQTSTCDDTSVDIQASQAIDELFEQESEPDSNDGMNSLLTSLSIVAEFTVSTDVLVTAGARSEQVTLIAAEHSYKQFGLESIPPKMSVHTVLPKAARTKYGLAGVANGLVPSHSMSSQYHIRELGLLVVEDLTESRFSNLIPRQIIEIMIRHRTKQFLIAQNDLARLQAYDKQRQKGTDRGIYENLIQQIQDDGDVNRCREWMVQRCHQMKEYIDMLRRLRRLYVTRDSRKEYFKSSTEKKNPLLRFLPVNLHLQEMWVGSATESFNSDESKAQVYDIVTVGAMAAHVYKFKNGGIQGMQDQRTKMKTRRREAPGSVAAHRQSPMWTEEEQKGEAFDWEIQKRMDACLPQAVAALVTAFTRKIDLALQNSQDDVGHEMLQHLEKLGFLFNVESLVSTHGNEAGMLEDMAGALNALRNVRFVLVDEEELKPKARDISLSFDVDEETKEDDSDAFTHTGSTAFTSQGSSTGPLAGVVDVNVFTNLDQALAQESGNKGDTNVAMLAPPSPAHSVANSAASFSNVGNFLMNTLRARSGRFFSSAAKSTTEEGVDNLFAITSLVIRVKVRTTRIKLPGSLAYGGTINVTPVLFTQGINEKQTLVNNTNLAATRLQETINENSLKLLRGYCDRYCNYIQSVRTRGTCPAVSSSALSRDQVQKRLSELDKLISSSKQTRKKRPEILQLTSDLCRQIGAGRVTVCKSAKDRTGMSVTLEQGRILVQNHGLPESKKAGIVSVMRSEGVRIDNAQKNTGRRVFAFNALQRSLLPEEYRCPPQTGGRNVS